MLEPCSPCPCLRGRGRTDRPQPRRHPPPGSLRAVAGRTCWLDSQGKPAQPETLLAPTSSCVSALRAATPTTANQVVQCFAQQPGLGCASPIGGAAVTFGSPPAHSGTPVASDPGQCDGRDAADCSRRCTAGNGPSCYAAGVLSYKENSPVTITDGARMSPSLNRALVLFTWGCNANHAPSCGALGAMYTKGEGARTDMTMSASLSQKACAGGDETGCQNVETIKQMLGGLPPRASPSGVPAPAPSNRGGECDPDCFYTATCEAYANSPSDAACCTPITESVLGRAHAEQCRNPPPRPSPAACFARVTSSSKRLPTMDPFCNPVHGRPANPGEAMPYKAFSAGSGDDFDKLQQSDCFVPLKRTSCTLTRSQRLNQTAWCCKASASPSGSARP